MDLIILHAISLPPGVFGTGHVIEFFMGRLDYRFHPSYGDPKKIRVSAHFFVDREGELHQFVDTDDTAWHAGESLFEGRPRCNDFSIGVELEGDQREPFTPHQYKGLTLLCAAIMDHYPTITAERIVAHSQVAPGRKWDPGPRFDWARFRRSLTEVRGTIS